MASDEEEEKYERNTPVNKKINFIHYGKAKSGSWIWESKYKFYFLLVLQSRVPRFHQELFRGSHAFLQFIVSFNLDLSQDKIN
jgi:hypothetical protein